MCGLCGDLAPLDHWTDRGPQGQARRHRLDRLRAVRRLLQGSGLTVTDWPGRGYQLGNGRGRTVLVRDLGALWEEAARMRGGRPVDPLAVAPPAAAADPSGVARPASSEASSEASSGAPP